MNHMTLSILSYNRLDFLKQSLSSALQHADEPLEIIVHDDGSTEPGLREWLVKQVAHGTISHLILNPPGHNEGQGIALNRLFGMAKGEIIIKADHDLIYKPGWTKAIRQAFEDNNEVRFPDLPSEHPENDVAQIGCLGLFKYHVEPVRWSDKLIAERGSYDEVQDFVGSLMAIPRDAWEGFGPFEERSAAFAEDAVFKQRIEAHPNWCNALTTEDFVANVGFGVGPSTLVEGFDSEGQGVLAKINPGPKLVGQPRQGEG